MKIFIFLTAMATAHLGWSQSWNCSFLEGEYLAGLTLQITVDESGGTIVDPEYADMSLQQCMVMDFDQKMMETALEYKIGMSKIARGEAGEKKIRETYGPQLQEALGGTLIVCSNDGVDFGVVANGEKSFSILDGKLPDGKSVVFEMTPGRCHTNPRK